ncbi:MAG: MFS transporter [Spirochaetales bacterium]|nr:MFS transporter [Spirochaetales bacterium]
MVSLLLAIIYLSFISLGLPDGILGSAWPVMYPQLSVPVSYMGIVTMIIAAGTIVSSLLSDRLTKAMGVGMVTAISVAMTAGSLFLFSVTDSFALICLWAIPYGLGAGSVDAALNNYVALHFKSRHMSWLHCFWGIGASLGPYIMGYTLSMGQSWAIGYRKISILQVVLTVILFMGLPLWRKAFSSKTDTAQTGREKKKPIPLREIISVPGAKSIMLTFLCYCALEITAGSWAASYLVMVKGIDEATAASFASLFYVGITVGRFFNGFVSMKLNDRQMIRVGQVIASVGIAVMLIPTNIGWISIAAFALVGLGCAPIYPSLIHSTPALFGEDRSQALIGVQMASAYIGSCLSPTFFGLISRYLGMGFLPVYIGIFTAVMILMHMHLVRQRGE